MDRPQNIADLLRISSKEFGNRTALSAPGPSPKSWTYAQAWDHVHEMSLRIGGQRLPPYKPILFISEPGPTWILNFLALLDAGHCVVPLPENLPLQIIGYCAKISGAIGAFLSESVSNRISKSLPLPHFTEASLKSERAPAEKRFITISREDVAVLAMTSGSTENSRMVQLTHENILSNVECFKLARQALPEDSLLSVLPPTHLFELVVGQLIPLSSGSRIVFAGSLLPNRIIDTIREEHISYTLVVPGLLRVLIQHYVGELVHAGVSGPEWLKASEEDLIKELYSNLGDDLLYKRTKVIREMIGSHLKAFVVGGASMNPAWAKILVALGIDLEVGYGLTEASPVVTLGNAREIPWGSVGTPLPGVEIKISEAREILVRGPNVMTGYLNNPKASATALQNGWLHTGDQGRLSEKGHLFIEGRIKEAMVTETGETIYPEEIEAFYSDPLFQDICVAPLPGPYGNDVPILVVMPAKPDQTQAEELRAKFLELKTKASARHKVFGVYRLDHPLPRTALGKPKRRQLISTLIEGMNEPWNQILQNPNFAR